MFNLQFLNILFVVFIVETAFAGKYNDTFYLGAAYDLPNLEFFDNSEFKNKPVMILKENGLFYKNKLICARQIVKFVDPQFHHRDRKAYPKGHANYHSTYNELDECPESPLIRSAMVDWPEDRTYHIEFETLSKNVMTIKYKNEKLYINLDSFKREPWMTIGKSYEKQKTPEIKKLLDNVSYQKFIAEMKLCLRKKDVSCLAKHIVSMNNEREVGDLVIKRFGRGQIDPREELKLNNNCDGELESEDSFAKCIVGNDFLVDQLTKCLDQKTFKDFYEISPNGRILKCYFYNFSGQEKGFKFINFFSAKYSTEPSQFDRNR